MVRRLAKACWYFALTITALFLVLALALQFTPLPKIIFDQAADSLADDYALELWADDVHGRFFPPEVVARGVHLAHPRLGRVISVPTISVSVSLSALLKGTLGIKRVVLKDAEILIMLKNGRWLNNPFVPKTDAPQNQATGPVKLQAVQLERAHLIIHDLNEGHADIEELSGVVQQLQGNPKFWLGFKTASVSYGGASLDLRRFHAQGMLKDGQLTLDSLKTGVDKGELFCRGQLALAPLTADLTVDLRAPLAPLEEFLFDRRLVEGNGIWNAKLTVAGGRFQLAGRASMGPLTLKGKPLFTAEGDFVLDENAVQLKHMTLHSAHGEVTLDTRIGLKGRTSISGTARLAHFFPMKFLEEHDVFKAVHYAFGLDGVSELSGSLAGPLDVKLNNRWTLQGLEVSGIPAKGIRNHVIGVSRAALQGPMIIGPAGVQIAPTQLQFSDSQLSVSGDVEWAGAGRLQLAITAPHIDLSDLSPISSLRLRGAGRLAAETSGSLSDPRLKIEFDIKHMFLNTMYVGDALGNLNLHGGTLELPVVHARSGESFYSLSAGLDLHRGEIRRAEIQMTHGRARDLGQALDISALLPADLDGVIDGTVQLRGPLGHWDGNIQMQGQAVTAWGETVPTARMNAQIHGGDWQIKSLELAEAGGKGLISGELKTSGDMELNVDLTNYPVEQLDHLKGLPFPVRGRLTGGGQITKKDGQYGGEILASVTALRVYEQAGSPAKIKARFGGDKLTLEGDLFRGELRASSTITLKDPYPYALQIRAAWHDLRRYLEGVSDDGELTLLAQGEATLHGTLSSGEFPAGHLRLTEFKVRNQDIEMQAADYIDLELKPHLWLVDPFFLHGSGNEMQLGGSFFPGEKWDLLTEGVLDLRTLPLLTRGIDKARGTLSYAVKISGTGEQPDFLGTAEVRDGFLSAPFFPHPFEKINGNATFDSNRVTVEDLTSRVALGKLTLGGYFELKKFMPSRFALYGNVKKAHLRFPSYWPTTLSGDLQVTGSMKHLLLTGDLRVEEARYTEDVKMEFFSSPLRSKLRRPAVYDESREFFFYDLHLTADGNVWIKNNMANAEAMGELRLVGSNQRFGMSGEAQLKQGTGRWGDLEYKLISGTIQFSERTWFNPQIDLLAKTQLRTDTQDDEITVSVTGTFEDKKLDFRSSRSMPKEDIIALLLTGLTASQAQQTTTAGDMYLAGGLAFNQLTGLDRSVKPLLPANTDLKLYSRFNSDTSTYLPVAELQTQISEKWRLSAIKSLYEQNDLYQASAEYYINPGSRLKLMGANSAKSRYGNFGLELNLHGEW